MTALFRRCLTLFISTLKYTTLIQRCLALQIPALKYKTLFQCWFDIVPRRDVVSTKKQRWNVCWDSSYLNWYKYFFDFEILAISQYYKNETEKIQKSTCNKFGKVFIRIPGIYIKTSRSYRHINKCSK